MAIEQGSPVEYQGIRISGDLLNEIESGRVMLSLPMRDVRRVELVHGGVAERPLVEIIVGAALVAVGCWPLLHLAYWAMRGGVFIKDEAWIVAAGGVGAYMIWHALRKGWYLRVETATAVRKLVFHGRIVEADARSFAARVQERIVVSEKHNP
jgi:hypothetical protein